MTYKKQVNKIFKEKKGKNVKRLCGVWVNCKLRCRAKKKKKKKKKRKSRRAIKFVVFIPKFKNFPN